MGVTNFPDGVNIGSDASATAIFQLGGTDVAITAAELNAIHDAGGLSDVEFDVLDGATKGTAVAEKALVMGAFKDIDTLDFQATSGLKIAGVAVTSSAAELNFVDTSVAGTAIASKALVLSASKGVDTLDITTPLFGGATVTASAAELNYIDTSVPGTAVASKALVLGAVKDIDTIDFASAAGVKIAGVALTATMAEINKLAGLVGAKVLGYDSATPQVVASGSTAITGAGTVDTGLAGGAVGQIVASIANAGTIAPTGDPLVVYARPTGSAGSVIFECYGLNGLAATNAGTIHWVALGTAA